MIALSACDTAIDPVYQFERIRSEQRLANRKAAYDAARIKVSTVDSFARQACEQGDVEAAAAAIMTTSGDEIIVRNWRPEYANSPVSALGAMEMGIAYERLWRVFDVGECRSLRPVIARVAFRYYQDALIEGLSEGAIAIHGLQALAADAGVATTSLNYALAERSREIHSRWYRD